MQSSLRHLTRTEIHSNSSKRSNAASNRLAQAPRSQHVVAPHHRRARTIQAQAASVQTIEQKQVLVNRPTLEFNSRSSEYSRMMKDAMGWGDRPYDYSYERGLYYHEIIPGLFVGSQPRHSHDIHELKSDLNLTHVLSLQQDKDMHHWGVRPDEISRKCSDLGLHLVRRPVQDFDPHSLRRVLPSAVRALHSAMSNGGRVYVHCTAGMGRAPGTVIAYLYWFCGMDLSEAYSFLTSIRPCGPKKEAIRGATFDLMSGQRMEDFSRVPEEAYTVLSTADQYAIQWRILKR